LKARWIKAITVPRSPSKTIFRMQFRTANYMIMVPCSFSTLQTLQFHCWYYNLSPICVLRQMAEAS